MKSTIILLAIIMYAPVPIFCQASGKDSGEADKAKKEVLALIT